MSTLDRLLRACDEDLEALPSVGIGIDRTEIRRFLALSPSDRARELVDEASALARLDLAVEVRNGV